MKKIIFTGCFIFLFSFFVFSQEKEKSNNFKIQYGVTVGFNFSEAKITKSFSFHSTPLDNSYGVYREMVGIFAETHLKDWLKTNVNFNLRQRSIIGVDQGSYTFDLSSKKVEYLTLGMMLKFYPFKELKSTSNLSIDVGYLCGYTFDVWHHNTVRVDKSYWDGELMVGLSTNISPRFILSARLYRSNKKDITREYIPDQELEVVITDHASYRNNTLSIELSYLLRK